MEKMIAQFGIGIFLFFFLCSFVIGSQFIWGAFVGMAIAVFGWIFWDD